MKELRLEESPMRTATTLVINEYFLRGFIAVALIVCRVKLGSLIPRSTRRR